MALPGHPDHDCDLPESSGAQHTNGFCLVQNPRFREQQGPPDDRCTVEGHRGRHTNAECWVQHPHLRPRKRRRRQHAKIPADGAGPVISGQQDPRQHSPQHANQPSAQDGVQTREGDEDFLQYPAPDLMARASGRRANHRVDEYIPPGMDGLAYQTLHDNAVGSMQMLGYELSPSTAFIEDDMVPFWRVRTDPVQRMEALTQTYNRELDQLIAHLQWSDPNAAANYDIMIGKIRISEGIRDRVAPGLVELADRVRYRMPQI